MTMVTRLSALVLVALLTTLGLTHSLYANKESAELHNAAQPATARDANSDDPWSSGDLIQPEELARLLSGQQKPIMFQIGIIHLYKIGHIPGSMYAGPANAAEGLDALKKQAQGLDRNSQVVCYCGCCPWENCPNTRPAYKTLRELGFKKIKMLYLPNTFGQDWTAKGYPVEKGS